MKGSSPPDPRAAQVRDLLLQLTHGRLDPPSGPVPSGDALDQVLALVKTVAEELTTLRLADAQASKRLHDIMDVIVALMSFNYEKKARISAEDDIFDGIATGLNTIGEELASSTGAKDYASNILESMADMLLVADEGGSIKTINHAACALSLYSSDELMHRPIGLLFADVFASELIERGGVTDREMLCRTKDRRVIPVSFSASIMRDYHGKVQGIVCVARDLSEGKRLEEERLRLRDAVQRQTILVEELSTPIIPISKELVVMPLVGSLDADRARRMTETLLHGVVSMRARVALLDITGVRAVDQEAMMGLIQAVQALRLIGAQVVLSGIRPDVAMMLVDLDADFSGVVTFGTLQRAMVYAMKRIKEVKARYY